MIDVLNQIWVAVFSAYVVEQHAIETRRLGSPGSAMENMDDFTREASALADAALASYRRVHGLDTTHIDRHEDR